MGWLGLCVWFGAVAAANTGAGSGAPHHPIERLIDGHGRAAGADLLYGARPVGPLDLVRRAARSGIDDAVLGGALSRERAALADPAQLAWAAHPSARLVAGTAEPVLMSGDEEHGLVSGRVGGLIWSHWGPGLVVLRPELGLDAGSETPTELRAELIEAWAGIQTDSWQVGFGATDRWIGPGRHGGLMLTDNAQAAPLASAAWEGRPWGRFGRVRVEVGAGWLDALRRDVAAPGWLLADLRWAPVPAFEMGATRMGIFGGAGRPAPEIGQLILPTRPHVDNDPDQALPDQDEIAALDGRLTLPLDDSLGGPLDWVELYIQYGGEDVIAREILTVPVPSLAGVANLYGLAVGAGPLEVDLEHARVLDDRFRWYTGHRIYHQGFTQAGRVMGHPSGGDSRTTSTAARWLTPGWGVEGSYEHVLRVGVAAIEGDNLQALMRDSTTHRVGLRGWRPDKRARWWHLDLNLERTAHPDFTPGAPSWAWRIAIGT